MSAPDLRLGRYQDVLADVECDAVIFDPPYSQRNHDGHNAYAGATTSTGGNIRNKDGHDRETIAYAHWTPEDVREAVDFWSPRARSWIVALTSHDLIPAWEAAHIAAGRYCFAPVPCVITGMSVRMMGDGPSSWAVYAVVARPRAASFLKWGTLPGAYVVSKTQSDSGGGRGKPPDLMRALVHDYSRPGDLVCDPTFGYCSTGVAALGMGRRFTGSEVDPLVFVEGSKRLAAVQPVDLFDPGRAQQAPLFAEPPRATRRKKAA